MIKPSFSIVAGVINCLLAVVLGAFGAHALKNHLTESTLAIWHTAQEYAFYHGLALILLGLWQNQINYSGRKTATFFLVGIILFSGSLYLLALTNIKQFGFITPVGGISLILGWVFWLLQIFKK